MQPLLTPEQMARADKATIDAGTSAEVLMDRAGRAVARAAIELMGGRYGKRALVVCGKGNNGGDGFVAARALRNEGVAVDCLVLFDPEEAKGAPAHHLKLMREAGVEPIRFKRDWDPPHGYDVAIDAIFGTGFKGAIEDESEIADVIELLDHLPVIAVDIPSGIDAATGEVRGNAVFATRTVTMAARKLGLTLAPNPAWIGEVEVADIGIQVPDAMINMIEAADVRPWLPQRLAVTHKKSEGTLVVLAGSESTQGAALLVARGAMRMGCGYVVLVSTPSVREAAMASFPELLCRVVVAEELGPSALDEIGSLLDDVGVAVAVGPGIGTGDAQSQLVRRLLREIDHPLVLDADALNVLEKDVGAVADRKHRDVVLTPHVGELGRLLGTSSHEAGSHRLAAAQDAARRSEAVVLAKGHATVIAHEDHARVVAVPAPALATAGTGDVLTGVIGARLASGQDGCTAATVSTYVHAVAGQVAADRHGPEGVVAMDVAEALPEAIEWVRAGLPSSS